MDENEDWKKYILSRCEELEPKVMGSVEPALDDALAYFKFKDVLFNVFGLGEDLSNHPRNPFKVLEKQKIMITEKDQKIIDFLQRELSLLAPRVMHTVEPVMSDRMTFFAYNQFLWRKYGIGQSLATHIRNPWKDCEAPLDFSEYSSIKPLPLYLLDEQKDGNQTPIGETAKKTQVIPKIPVEEPKWRVFDIDKPLRKIFEGTEAECYKYTAKANKDIGYKAFDYEVTQGKTFPSKKELGFSKPIKSPENTTCCNRPVVQTYCYKTSRTKVQEYLDLLKSQGLIQAGQENPNLDKK